MPDSKSRPQRPILFIAFLLLWALLFASGLAVIFYLWRATLRFIFTYI